jgi:hypothetical protein
LGNRQRCHGGGYTGVTFPPLTKKQQPCPGDGGSVGWLPGADGPCRDNHGTYPEEFWNCADVRIVAASGPTKFPTSTATPTTPEPKPSLRPTTTGKPTPAGGHCSALWNQCGGQGWAGAMCCSEGAKCVKQSVYYSQCVEDPSATCVQLYKDCSKAGSHCCAGSACVLNKYKQHQCEPHH